MAGNEYEFAIFPEFIAILNNRGLSFLKNMYMLKEFHLNIFIFQNLTALTSHLLWSSSQKTKYI